MSRTDNPFELVTESVYDSLDQLARDREKAVASKLMEWVSDPANTAKVPDLAERLAQLEKKVDRLAKGVKVRVEQGKCVVKVNGADMETLKQFRLGTKWFKPHPDPVLAVIEAILTET